MVPGLLCGKEDLQKWGKRVLSQMVSGVLKMDENE
jgi:hypothetical protein